MVQFSGKLAALVARDCCISEHEAALRLVEVAGRKNINSKRKPVMMSAWGIEWKISHLSCVAGLSNVTLKWRWDNGIRYPDLVKPTLLKGSVSEDEAHKMAAQRDVEACEKLLQLLREHHPDRDPARLRRVEADNTAAGVINGSRFRSAAFAGVRSAGHMEAI